MKEKIDIIIENEENIEKIAVEISDAFFAKMEKSNIDYSFDIAKGTGKIKSKKPNTTFFFDTDEDTVLDSLKKALFDEELSYIKGGSKEEEALMEKVGGFLGKVTKHINVNYYNKMEEAIRRVVLPKSSSQDIPLDEIEIVDIDVADFSSVPLPAKYMLKIGKKPNCSVNTDTVTTFIHDEQERTGESVKEVFEREKLINPLFKDILSIERGIRYLYDVNITLFVDYSLASLPPEEIVRKQLKVKK
jgi:hypothetical protein